MKNIWIIAKREFRSFFDSLVGYILLVAFLGLTGFFVWGLPSSNVFANQQANLGLFFAVAYWSFFLFIPALTMRMVAEEKKTGTLETLLTRAVSDWQVVAGKYLGCMLLIIMTLAFTLPFYFAVAWLGPVDHGAVWCGYLGLILLGSAYVAIGIFISSLTDNQIVAFLLALGVILIFHWILSLVSGNTLGGMGQTLNTLSASTHYDSLTRGVIDTRDVLYFIIITLLGLILAESRLAKRFISA